MLKGKLHAWPIMQIAMLLAIVCMVVLSMAQRRDNDRAPSDLTINSRAGSHFQRPTERNAQDFASNQSRELAHERLSESKLRLLSQTCGLPLLPAVSFDRDSELEAVREMNQWIACHNHWVATMQTTRAKLGLGSHARPDAQIATDFDLLMNDEQKALREANRIYVEWKRNSTRLKQHLGFRHHLYNEHSSN